METTLPKIQSVDHSFKIHANKSQIKYIHAYDRSSVFEIKILLHNSKK